VTPSHFENDNITLDVERKPHCQVRFDIVTKPIATKAAKEKALRNVAREVNIPGFRKGKAPADLILKQFKPQVEREERELILRNALDEALKLSKLHLLSEKSPVNLVKCQPVDDTHYQIIFDFETFPLIPPLDLQSLKMESIVAQAADEKEIEEKIDELQIYHATWHEVADRPAEEEDYVTLDIDLIDDTPQAAHRDSRFQLKEKKIPEWARKLIVGLKKGDSAEGFSAQEESSDAPFTPRKCRITIKKIETAALPALDDELAKKAGVNSVEELKRAIRSSLEKEHAYRAQAEMRHAIRKLLLEKVSFELPKSRLDSISEECHEKAEQQKTHFKTDEDLKKYEEKLLADHSDALKFSFVLPYLIQDLKIAPPPIEVLRERVMGYLINRQMQGHPQLAQEQLEQLTRFVEQELWAEAALDTLIIKATGSD